MDSKETCECKTEIKQEDIDFFEEYDANQRSFEVKEENICDLEDGDILSIKSEDDTDDEYRDLNVASSGKEKWMHGHHQGNVCVVNVLTQHCISLPVQLKKYIFAC